MLTLCSMENWCVLTEINRKLFEEIELPVLASRGFKMHISVDKGPFLRGIVQGYGFYVFNQDATPTSYSFNGLKDIAMAKIDAGKGKVTCTVLTPHGFSSVFLRADNQVCEIVHAWLMLIRPTVQGFYCKKMNRGAVLRRWRLIWISLGDDVLIREFEQEMGKLYIRFDKNWDLELKPREGCVYWDFSKRRFPHQPYTKKSWKLEPVLPYKPQELYDLMMLVRKLLDPKSSAVGTGSSEPQAPAAQNLKTNTAAAAATTTTTQQ